MLILKNALDVGNALKYVQKVQGYSGSEKKTVKWWQKFLTGVSVSGAPHAFRHANPERYGLCGTGNYSLPLNLW